MNRNKTTLRTLIMTALFIAIMLALQLTGLGLINLGIINITFYCTLIAIGTLSIGLVPGLVMAFVFAAISFWKALSAPSGLVLPIIQLGGVGVAACFLMSFVPRLLVPLAVHFASKTFGKKKPYVGMTVGAVLGSLTNTVLYLGILLLSYALLISTYSGINEKGFAGILTVVGGVVLYGGIPEAVAAGLLVPPIVTAIKKIKH